MMDDKKMCMKKMPKELEAKMEVVKALRKMAMELLAEQSGEEDGAVVAEVEMKKMPRKEAMEALGDEMADAKEGDGELEAEEDDVKLLDKMIQKKKLMA